MASRYIARKYGDHSQARSRTSSVTESLLVELPLKFATIFPTTQGLPKQSLVVLLPQNGLPDLPTILHIALLRIIIEEKLSQSMKEILYSQTSWTHFLLSALATFITLET